MIRTEKILNILLVEDNPGDARLFTEILANSAKQKPHIKNVTSIAEAISVLESEKFDVVILDLGLPDSKGFDTFNKLNNLWNDGPVIVLTGNNDEELGRTIVRMGAQDFLVKGQYDETLISKSIQYAIDRYNSKKIIAKKEENFREIIEKNADGMVVTGEDNEILFVNPVAENLLNAKNEKLIGKKLPFELNEGILTEEVLSNSDGSRIILQLKVVSALWDNKPAQIATFRDITVLKSNQEEVIQLNKLLKTIGSINHLIVTEKNKGKLLEKACNLLTEGRNYNSAWIGLFDENASISMVTHSKLDGKFEEFRNFISLNKKLHCLEKLSKNKNICRIENPRDYCDKCPLTETYTSQGTIAVNIFHKNETLGVLVVALPDLYLHSEQEYDLLQEVAADLGLAIHTIEIEAQEKSSQEKLMWVNEALKEAANAVVLTDTKGIIKWVNPAYTKLTGYSIEEAVGSSTNILKSGKHDKVFYENLWKTITSGKIWKGEVINKKKDGLLYTEEMTITPVKDSRGNINRFIAIKSDITLRKNSEYKLSESEAKHRLLAENSVDVIWQLDSRLKFTYLSPGLKRMTGYDPGEWIGTFLWKHASFKEFMKMGRLALKALKEGEENSYFIFETKMINKKGEEFPVEISSRVLFDENNKTIGLQGSTREIKERIIAKKREEKNREISQSLYSISKMIDESEDRIIDVALEAGVKFTESEGGYLHFMNTDDVSLSLFKWSKSVHDICQAEKIPHYPLSEAGIWADCVRTRKPVVHNDYPDTADKKGLPEGHFPLLRHMSIPIFEGDSVKAVCGVGNKASDYTEDDVLTLSLLMNEMWKLISRKRAEQKLAESERRYRGLYENAPIGIYRSKLDGEIVIGNPTFTNMLGLKSIDGNKVSAMNFYKNPKDREFFVKQLKEKGAVRNYEFELLTANGEILHVRDNAMLVIDNGIETIEGVIQDITESKKYEKELVKAKEEADRSNKLKSEFLAQMSHEIRTPLNSMLSSINFLKDDLEENLTDGNLDMIGIVDESGKRIIKTIESILNMSELQTGSYEPLFQELNLIKDVIEPVLDNYLEKFHSKKLKLVYKPDHPEIKLKADLYSLTKIIDHLVDNAYKYTDSGSVTINIANENDQLMLSIEDTGIGISTEYLENIFNPFSQEYQGYCRPYDGCGLGLAISKKYCELNNMDIEIHSKRDVGTKVELKFNNIIKAISI